jgi:hypothetical protein
LVSKYTFDSQDITDEWGPNTGINDGAGFSSGYDGQGSSISFTGSSQVDLAFIEDSIIKITQDFTISHWFKLDSIRTDDYSYTLSSRQNSFGVEQGGVDFMIDYVDSTCLMVMRRRVPFGDIVTFRTTEKVTVNQWHHVLLTRQDSTISMYYDGQMDISGVMNPSTNEVTDPYFWSIGGIFTNTGGARRALNGSVDEIRFYNRPLSSAEVLQLYNLQMAATTNELSSAKNLHVFPNPANNKLQLSNEGSGTFKLYNAAAKLVIEGTLSSNQIIDVSTLATGMYFIQAEIDKVHYYQKFFKN